MLQAVDKELEESLTRRFNQNMIIPEWDVARNSQDDYNRLLYCPRIDFAIGPFNINREMKKNNKKINEEYRKHESFFNRVKEKNLDEWRVLIPNKNPRCFIAIEVEKSGSRKHRIGSIMNASAIGKVGILVAADETNFKALNRIRRYLDFVYRAKKMESYPQNVLIIRRYELLDIL